MMTSHLVVLQMCWDVVLIASGKRVRPVARSTASTGTTKLSRGASSGITALGRTKAPVDISWMLGVEGDTGFDARTTFAKWVGTETFGGLPITSWVTLHLPSASSLGKYKGTVNT